MKRASNRLRFEALFISIQAYRISLPCAHGHYPVVVGEFDNSDAALNQALPLTPSWTNSLREFGPERSEGFAAVRGEQSLRARHFSSLAARA